MHTAHNARQLCALERASRSEGCSVPSELDIHGRRSAVDSLRSPVLVQANASECKRIQANVSVYAARSALNRQMSTVVCFCFEMAIVFY